MDEVSKMTMKIRRKILGCLRRKDLEDLSNMESPWHANKGELIDRAAIQWDEDEVHGVLKGMLREARG
jgi:hypothetical protein